MNKKNINIDYKDISVVVQGAISKYTKKNLSSIRKFLPGAIIVLSTWKDSDVDGLDYDKLVESRDPGNFDCMNSDYSKANNIERQVISTYNGLKVVTTKYAIKFRTDFEFTSNCFLQWWGKYSEKDIEFGFFKERLLCCDTFCRNPRLSSLNCAHIAHPSDFFFFGLTLDLLNLFHPFTINDEDRIWFAIKERNNSVLDLNRFVPEQFLWINFLKRNGVIDQNIPQSMVDKTKEKIVVNEKIFAANLVILSKDQLGIESEKGLFSLHEPESCYRYSDWLLLYKGYSCNSRFYVMLYLAKIFLKNNKFRIKKAGEFTKERIIVFAEKVFLRVRDFLFLQKRKNMEKQNKSDAEIDVWFKRYFNKSVYYKRTLKNEKPKYVISKEISVLEKSKLSVIVQGAISDATKKTLDSIRHNLPGAEIVLSTWKDSIVDGLDYDRLVLSEDPGSNGLIRRYPYEQSNNTDREIVSTLAGLKGATKEYALKIRSDMQIESDAFIRYYNMFSKYVDEEIPLTKRVMVEGLFTDPKLLFDVSDWWYLGMTADLKKIFDIPLVGKEETPYFEQEKNLCIWPKGETVICRYIPETYIFYKFMTKNYRHSLYMDNMFDSNNEAESVYHKLISGGLICIESNMSGVVLPKAKNVCNTASYYYNFSLSKWAEWAVNDKMIPYCAQKWIKECNNNYFKEIDKYAENYYYYNCKFWNNIIFNYKKKDKAIIDDSGDRIVEKKEITFIVRGELKSSGEYNTISCLNSIKRFYKESKVILAVWENEKNDYLDKIRKKFPYIVIVSVRPFQNHSFHMQQPNYNSINNQRKMVFEALQQVRTKYVFVFKSDFCFINDNALFFYNKWKKLLNKYDPERRLFSERIVTYRYYMYDPRLVNGTKTFCLSDIIQVGRYRDICSLWREEYISQTEQTYLVKHTELYNPDGLKDRYLAEQHFLLNLVKKKYSTIDFPKWYIDNKTNNYIFEYERILASNFIIGNGIQLGIKSELENHNDERLLTHSRLLELYLYYIDNNNADVEEFIRKMIPEKLVM